MDNSNISKKARRLKELRDNPSMVYEPVDDTQPEVPMGAVKENNLTQMIQQQVQHMFDMQMAKDPTTLDDALGDPDDFEPDFDDAPLSGHEVVDLQDEDPYIPDNPTEPTEPTETTPVAPAEQGAETNTGLPAEGGEEVSSSEQ